MVNNDLRLSTIMSQWKLTVWSICSLSNPLVWYNNTNTCTHTVDVPKQQGKEPTEIKTLQKIGEVHDGKVWELIMQIPQLQRNNNSGNSKTNHNTEAYCLVFAYLLDNYNLLIMPILLRTMSLYSNNNAHITNWHSALFLFKWKLCRLS